MQSLDWNALKAVHDHFMRTAFAICANGQEVHPQLFAVRANSKGRIVKMSALPPELTGRFMRNDQSKDAFSDLLRDMLTEGTVVRDHLLQGLGVEPNVLVQVNEAWMATADKDGAVDMQTRPSLQPNRKEVLLISLHTPGLSVPVFHEIVDKPKRHAVQGSFPTQADAQLAGGRFAMQDAFGERDAVKH